MAKIFVFSIMHNEEVLLPYFLKHYETFAAKIFIVDAHSTDRTIEITKQHPKVEILTCPYGETFTEEDVSFCYQNYYKAWARHKADWAMCVDGDEFVYHPDIQLALSHARDKSADVIRTTCYTMVADHLPTTKGQIYEELNEGIRSDAQDKPIIFNPERDLMFTSGRHSLVNRDDLHIVKVKVRLLHYRYLTEDYAVERTQTVLDRLNEKERIKAYRIRRNRAWYQEALKKSRVVV